MNSRSKYPLNGDSLIDRQDQNCNCHPRGSKVIFENNYGNLGPLDVTFAEGLSNQTISQPVASVTVDTKCLDCANIIIDFTGILNVTTTISAISTLTFTLFKLCDDMRMRQPVSTVNFFVADIAGGVTASHTLAFKFPLNSRDCNDCCTYILELTSIYNLDFGTVTYAINGILSALVIDSAC
jgi:hypothetical protein